MASDSGRRNSILNGLGERSSVYLRDTIDGTTTLLSDPADGNATAPTISANGALVGYEQGGNVYVADRQVTGTGHDLPYEHVVGCPARLGAGRVTPCGPRLSADGSTLVYPAELTPVSPELSVTATLDQEEGSPRDQPASVSPALTGDTLDLTPYYPGQYYGYPDATAVVAYRNAGATPVSVSGLTVGEPPGFPSGEPFELGQDGCGGVLKPGSSCTATVSYQTEYCPDGTGSDPALVTGTLSTQSAEPAGQSGLELTALCNPDLTDARQVPGGRGGAVTAAYRTAAASAGGQPGCAAPPRGLALTAAPALTSDIEGAPVSNAGGVEIGRPEVIWMPVSVPAQAGGTGNVDYANVDFAGANGDDCGIQLVNPARLRLADPLPSSAPAACRQGELLVSDTPPPTDAAGAPSSCTAYLLIEPGAVAPDAAYLGTTYQGNYYQRSDVPTAYVTAQGVTHLIVARRDVDGTGNFGSAASTVVSVTGQGAELPGATEPSVSADGQYVSFAAPVPFGSRGRQVAAGASQVWEHDVVWVRDRAGKRGLTTMVSCLPRARAGLCRAGSAASAANADSPSVSGDGRQVAFATTAAVLPHNGYPTTTGGSDAGAGGRVSADQVFVRSVLAGTSVLVSLRPFRSNDHDDKWLESRGGNGASYAPVMTQDASTVAYVSRATDLTSARAGSTASTGSTGLYLQAASGGGASELAAVAGQGTAIGMPSADAHGRLVTFPASGALTTTAPHGIASVYTFDRRPSFTSSPAAAGFGSVLLDSRPRVRLVTITDNGPGPGTVTGAAASGPFRVLPLLCVGVTLQPGSRCRVLVTFRPSSAGLATGTLSVITQDDDLPPVIAGIPATATVPPPLLVVSPGVGSAGDACVVTGSSFPPFRRITLTWSPGLGSAVAITSRKGGFSSAMVIFPDDVVGPRSLIASGIVGQLATAPFLVQQGTDEPPFTARTP
jgi:hypothetical protein